MNLKRGDILNRRRNHVRIFNRWIGARVQVYEAAGLPRGPRQNYQREFRANDRFGRVVRNTLAWDRRYTPLSPFPQYEVMEPTTSPVMEVRPTFRVRIRGSGDLELQEFVFDNACVHPQIINNPSSHTMDLNYTPSRDLSPSRKHTLYIRAMNRVVNQSFVDKFRWRFSLML